MTSVDCDVVVIGGGPAGATAAAWLAQHGRRVVVLERDRFPRFHIGESLLASVNEVLDAIGAADLVRQAGFPRKWGATFMTADGAAERYADFAISGDVPQPQTWQVRRDRFDELLLRHAAASGADVRELHRVRDIEFDDGGVTVRFAAVETGSAGPVDAGSVQQLRAHAVVDASGRAGLLAHKLDLRRSDPGLANVAIFSHYSGVPRAAGRRAGDIRIVARGDLGWFWMIPVSDDLMSIGAVLPQALFKPRSRLAPEELLQQLIAETPAVARLTATAAREWPVRVEADFSYGAARYCGDRWITIGDAGSFLDPVFSTGVAIALESGLEGARAIDDGLSSGDLRAATFRTFEERQRQRYLTFRQFVRGFYTTPFRDLFFSPNPPPHMFRAVVTVFAGYWRPSLWTRLWVRLFFLIVRLQPRLKLVPSHLGGKQARPSLVIRRRSS